MASILDLPPEVLQEIFLVPFAAEAPRFYSTHRDRARDLASFSLVHSRWRSLAQSLLVKEIWVVAHGQARVTAGSCRSQFRGAKVLMSTVTGELEKFSEVAESASRLWIARWMEIRSLRILYGVVSIDIVRRFTNLESLALDESALRFSTEDSLSFPRLRRLVLSGDTKLSGNISLYRKFFSPTTMPQLAHLAFDVSPGLERFPNHPFPHAFANVLTQIETIISRRSSIDSAPWFTARSYNGIARPPQQSFEQGEFGPGYYLPHFLLDTAGLKLKSLHVSRANVRNYGNECILQVLADQEAKKEKLEVKNLFVYGKGEVGDLRAFFGAETIITRIKDVAHPPLE